MPRDPQPATGAGGPGGRTMLQSCPSPRCYIRKRARTILIFVADGMVGTPPDASRPQVLPTLRARIAGVWIEQLLAVDPVTGDRFLALGRHQPVDELLPRLLLYGWMFLRVHQHDAVLVEQPLVAFDRDDELAAVFERQP